MDVEENRAPLAVDSISLDVQPDIRLDDLQKVLEKVSVVLHAGPLHLRVTLSELPIGGGLTLIGTRNGETLPRLGEG